MLGANKGFWQIQLTYETSFLAAVFGRFRFLRIPFGISRTPATFHKVGIFLGIFTDILDIPGVKTYIDDIIVYYAKSENNSILYY